MPSLPSSLSSGTMSGTKLQFDQPSKRNDTKVLSLMRQWFLEICSLTIAIGTFAIIIILLATRQGKPQPDWPSLLNINTLLSILTTVLRAAMLFPIAEGIEEMKWVWFAEPHPLRDIDRFSAAGKSPWGAIKLLCKRPADVVTSVGAAIIVLSLAIDPFSQQVLEFYSCPQSLKGDLAVIPRTNRYTLNASQRITPESPVVSGKMTAALYQGLLTPSVNASSVVATSCPSGNCTFAGMYTSLSMCSFVRDVSDKVTGGDGVQSDNYTLPSGVYITRNNALATMPTDVDVGSFSEDQPMFAMDILMARLNCEYDGKAILGGLTEPRAFHVTLSPCIHAYDNISYINAIFDEHVVSTHLLAAVELYHEFSSYYSLAGDFPSSPGIDCTPSKSPQGSKVQPTSLLSNGLRYANYRDDALSRPDVLYFDHECVYDFGTGPSVGLAKSLGTVFFGTDTYAQNNLTTPAGCTAPFEGDEWLKTLWANGTADIASVTRFMDGVVDSMSAVIRGEGDPSHSEPLLGVVLINETCVGVFWTWLALPAALLLCTIVFVSLVVFRSERYTRLGAVQSGRKPWKSSTLPLIWCGIEESTRYQFPCFTEVGDMETSADMVKARLKRVVGDVEGRSNGLGHARGRWILQQEISDNNDKDEILP
ncbi:hypothetical protein F4678DRAFT_482803 [Xylaria arbuscula]|nr:hypothetical protein F4678DRAFT_482803 [Xylaria arbuscula]